MAFGTLVSADKNVVLELGHGVILVTTFILNDSKSIPTKATKVHKGNQNSAALKADLGIEIDEAFLRFHCYGRFRHDKITRTRLLRFYPSYFSECIPRVRSVRSPGAAQPVCLKSLMEFALNKGTTAVIVGAQWGDEGKGKIVDVLSENFTVVARYAGGHNAGHTVIINGKKFVLQLVPCGVLRPGCRSVIGNGVVLDPLAFLKEVGSLREAGVKVDGHLFVSNRAHVILPYHRMIELASENAPGRVKIGTTSRGIGPAYEDKMGRRGLRVADLLDLKLLKTHIENAVREKNMIAHALFNSEPLDADKMFHEYADIA